MLDLIASAKSLAQSALAESDSDVRTELSLQYDEIIAQIGTVVADSNYKGANLLGGTTESLTVTFDESGDSQLTVAGIDGSGGVAVSGTWATLTEVATDIGLLDAARVELRTGATGLSNQLSTITIRQDFTDQMINTLEDGAANLTNADLNEEGANLLMLQTRQQLGTTSLSMASQAAQSILRLF